MISNVLEEILDLLMPEGWDSLDKNSFNWVPRRTPHRSIEKRITSWYWYLLVSFWDYSAGVGSRSRRFERILWYSNYARIGG